MAFDPASLIRNLISGPVLALAGPLRTSIVVTPVGTKGTYGSIPGTPFDALALVENVSVMVTDSAGRQKLSTAKFTFLEPIAIQEGDRITLNEVTTTVVKIGGLLDDAGVPYVPEAWTGQ